VPNLTQNTYKKRKYRSHELAVRMSSLALFLTAISSRSADLAHKVHWTLCLSQITL
ncbi:hypothetical protein HMPREF3216_00987, partial [Gardnerella vaginalis]